MSFIPVLQNGVGLAIFGFVYWILDGIIDDLIAINIHVTGNAFNLLMYIWTGALIIYIIFGGWWLIRKYNEEQYARGGF